MKTFYRSKWNNGTGWWLLNLLKTKPNHVSCILFWIQECKQWDKFPVRAQSVTQMCRCVEADTSRWTHIAINKVATVRLPNWTFEKATGINEVTRSPQLLMLLWLSLLKRTMRKKKKNTWFFYFSWLSLFPKDKDSEHQWNTLADSEHPWNTLAEYYLYLYKFWGTQKIKRKRKTELVYYMLIYVAFLGPLGLELYWGPPNRWNHFKLMTVWNLSHLECWLYGRYSPLPFIFLFFYFWKYEEYLCNVIG